MSNSTKTRLIVLVFVEEMKKPFPWTEVIIPFSLSLLKALTTVSRAKWLSPQILLIDGNLDPFANFPDFMELIIDSLI